MSATITRHPLPWLAGAAALVGLLAWSQRQRILAQWQERRFTAILSAPTGVDGYRVEAHRLDLPVNTPHTIGGHPILHGPIQLGADFAAKLGAALLAARHAPPDNIGLGCNPHPGVGYVFHENGQALQVLVCLECGEAVIVTEKRLQVSWWVPLNQQYRTVVALTKQAFPKDPDVQDVKDEG